MQLPWSGFYWFNSLRGAGSDAEMPPVSSCPNEAMRNGEGKENDTVPATSQTNAQSDAKFKFILVSKR